MPLSILVQRVRHPRKRERYMATVQRADGGAVHTRPFERASDAVRYAERVPLTCP
jgi:hypothetical protein